MRITKVKLDNYVCFNYARPFELGPNITFVVGKNNSGKTALVRALGSNPNVTTSTNTGHRSIHSLIASSGQLPTVGVDVYRLWYAFDYDDLFWSLCEVLSSNSIPIPVDPDVNTESAVYDFLSDGFAVCCIYRAGRPPIVEVLRLESFRPEHATDHVTVVYVKFLGDFRLSIGPCIGKVSFQTVQAAWKDIIKVVPKRIFRLHAERRVRSRAVAERETDLAADGSNLPQVLFTLRNSKPKLFSEYMRSVKRVFPEIHDVLTVPSQDSDGPFVQIRIDFDQGQEDFPELRRPLEDCGSGVGQVLAILYVVQTSKAPSVILVDEPQSFLHPDAVRKLLHIFQLEEHMRHQYVITTHSPAAIASVQEKALLLLTQDSEITDIQALSAENVGNLGLTLRAVGARLSDVFGMDNIIWVEGETDEICFPLILRANRVPLFGTVILRLAHTGDLSSKDHGATAVKLYKRLCGGEGLMPSALAFIFDADLEKDLQPVRAELGHLVKLLPRQNYESYLIDAEAIAHILNEDDPDHAGEYSRTGIQEWIDQNYACAKFYPKESLNEGNWICCIDGARFVSELFSVATENRVAYDKISHTPRLTRRILKSNSDHFQEIVNLIKPLLKDEL